MARKAPTDEHIQSLLKAENFDPGVGLAITGELPVTPTMMCLPIDQIATYKRNPRKTTHQKFEEMVQSIIDKGGVINPISVTKRPGDDRFFVSAGGNTRLLAQKEAWKRTRDNRLEKMNVMFNPYIGEVNIVVDHLIENDMRSDNTFLEKAQAIYTIMEWIQAENTEQNISLRQWITILKERYGYAVSRSDLRRYMYAMEKLYPYIPQALEAGMVQMRADEIRKLEARISKYAKSLGLAESPLTLAFQQALLTCDTLHEFSMMSLEQGLFSQIGAMTGQSGESFQAALCRYESGASEGLAEPGIVPVTRSGPALVVSNDQVPSSATRPGTVAKSEEAHRPPSVRPEEAGSRDEPSLLHPDESTSLPLHRQRAAAFQSAQAVAAAAAIEDCVRPLSAGFGFYIEVPEKPLVDPDEPHFEKDDNTSASRAMPVFSQSRETWWLLTELSGVFNDGARFQLFDDESVLKQSAAQCRSTAHFFERLETLVQVATYHGTWSTITDPAFPIQTFSSLVQIIQGLQKGYSIDALWTAG